MALRPLFLSLPSCIARIFIPSTLPLSLFSYFGCVVPLVKLCKWPHQHRIESHTRPWTPWNIPIPHAPQRPGSLGLLRETLPIRLRILCTRSSLHLRQVGEFGRRGLCLRVRLDSLYVRDSHSTRPSISDLLCEPYHPPCWNRMRCSREVP